MNFKTFSSKSSSKLLINGETKTPKELTGKNILLYKGSGFEIQLKINGYNDDFIFYDVFYVKLSIWPEPFSIYPSRMPICHLTYSEFSRAIYHIISSWKRESVERSNSIKCSYYEQLRLQKLYSKDIKESIFSWSEKQKLEMINNEIKDIEDTVKLYQNIFEDLTNHEDAIIASWPKLA